MVKNQNKGKRKADTQKMGKKPFTSTSPIQSIVDLTTSSANCVPPPSPSATNIWTKKGMTETFLGITACFPNSKSHVRHHIPLSCVSFPSSHTAENICVLFKQELTNWGINLENVSIVQTDSAANMVVAFKMHDTNLDQYVTDADELKAIDEAVLQCMMDQDNPREDYEEAAKTVEAFEKFEVEAESLFEE
ncbi:hypothetical protein RvY_09717 [Ramazzottius varieornatus]|uniref:Uncharacterized protein n=1 Tax=Ramazzottius varieornatus TaxID=947166 RepID=A0A1D1VCG7_RAMVA|nr:hypothetical protein RvY_09717 [Ramazzottius varieornatus]